MAICFRCGADKPRALDACAACGSGPRTNRQYLLSVALSSQLSSPEELAHYQNEILAGRRALVPNAVFQQAIEALKDPAILSSMRSRPLGATPSTLPPARPAPRPAGRPAATAAPASAAEPRKPVLRLEESAFAQLAVSTRDSAERIRERARAHRDAPERARYEQLAADLLDHRSRLAAELAWLPGVSPEKVDALLDRARHEPESLRAVPDLPVLARLNLLAVALESADARSDTTALAGAITDMGNLVSRLSAAEILKHINGDRAASGFTPMLVVGELEEGLALRRRHYIETIGRTLDRLPSDTLVDVMNTTLEAATEHGHKAAPAIVAGLVDRYETAASTVLQAEAANIDELVARLRSSAAAGDGEVEIILQAIEELIARWSRIARPVQRHAETRRITHQTSRRLAYTLRRLAIELFNEHGLLDPALRITRLLQDRFDAVPDVAERATRDARALAQLATGPDRQALR